MARDFRKSLDEKRGLKFGWRPERESLACEVTWGSITYTPLQKGPGTPRLAPSHVASGSWQQVACSRQGCSTVEGTGPVVVSPSWPILEKHVEPLYLRDSAISDLPLIASTSVPERTAF